MTCSSALGVKVRMGLCRYSGGDVKLFTAPVLTNFFTRNKLGKSFSKNKGILVREIKKRKNEIVNEKKMKEISE